MAGMRIWRSGYDGRKWSEVFRDQETFWGTCLENIFGGHLDLEMLDEIRGHGMCYWQVNRVALETCWHLQWPCLPNLTILHTIVSLEPLRPLVTSPDLDNLEVTLGLTSGSYCVLPANPWSSPLPGLEPQSWTCCRKASSVSLLISEHFKTDTQ